jgi:hypothetical protein
MPLRVFLSKSADVIENKGRESGKKLQESSRVRKRKEVKEIGEVNESKDKISARFVGSSGAGIGFERRDRGVGGDSFDSRPNLDLRQVA